MTNKFSLGFEITADPAKAKAGLAETRRELLQTYSETRQQVEKLSSTLEQAKNKAAEMGRSLSANGPPTKGMVADFEKARAAVRSAQEAVEKNTLALQQARQATRENAQALAEVARAESDLALKTAARTAAQAVNARNQALQASMGTLGTRSGSAIQAEILETQRAIASLRANGAVAGDIQRAAEAAKIRLAALNAELKGTVPAGNAASNSLSGVAHRMAAMTAAALAVRGAAYGGRRVHRHDLRPHQPVE